MTARPLHIWAALLGGTVLLHIPALQAQDRLRVVTSLTTYADIARQIAGNRAEVTALGDGAENPHFVQPRPSLVLDVRRADMLVTTGLDLELWLPALLDKANNPGIASGAPGFVAAAAGIKLVEVPATVSRSEGDAHVYGNPHIWTEPANAVVIGRNILTGLKRLDPASGAYYDQRFAAWKDRLTRAHLGDELVELLGADLLADLDYEGRLWTFLSEEQYQGRPLLERLGGWLAQGRAFRGREMVCYHKEWSYFSRAFGITCIEFIEPKPGIPPTPGHVARVMSLMRERQVPVLLSTNYFDRQQVRMVARRTGATAVVVPSSVGGAPGTDTYIDLVTLWVTELARAFDQGQIAPTPAAQQMAIHLQDMVARMHAGAMPAIRHLERPELQALACRLYREARVRGVLAVLNRVSDPDTARYLRRTLEPQGPPVIGILAEDPSIRGQWLRAERVRSTRLTNAVSDLTRALEAAQGVAAAGPVPA